MVRTPTARRRRGDEPRCHGECHFDAQSRRSRCRQWFEAGSPRGHHIRIHSSRGDHGIMRRVRDFQRLCCPHADRLPHGLDLHPEAACSEHLKKSINFKRELFKAVNHAINIDRHSSVLIAHAVESLTSIAMSIPAVRGDDPGGDCSESVDGAMVQGREARLQLLATRHLQQRCRWRHRHGTGLQGAWHHA